MSDWLPGDAVVRPYVADWTAIKLRWSLTVDPAEQQTLTDLAADCPNAPVTVATATNRRPPPGTGSATGAAVSQDGDG